MDSLYFFTLLVFLVNLNLICARIHKPMAKKRFRITEKDFLLANRKASREEEIAKYGKQIMFRTTTQKSKKVYDRKRLKKAGINSDDLPLMIIASPACTCFLYLHPIIIDPDCQEFFPVHRGRVLEVSCQNLWTAPQFLTSQLYP